MKILKGKRKMVILGLVLIALISGGITVTLISFGSESDSAVSENQIVAVQRGDLMIDITAVGNLALSLKEDLAFEISGYVEEVLVEEGDTVEEGQVLASLDTSEWEKELTARESDLLQAEINFQTAEYNLNVMQEVQEAQDAVEDAEYNLKFVKSILAGEFGGGVQLSNYSYWYQLKALAEEELAEAQQEVRDILAGSSVKVTTEVATQVALKKLQGGLAQRRLEAAQKAEEEALDASPEIIAPFDGFITKVNVDGGDEVKKGTVAVILPSLLCKRNMLKVGKDKAPYW